MPKKFLIRGILEEYIYADTEEDAYYEFNERIIDEFGSISFDTIEIEEIPPIKE